MRVSLNKRLTKLEQSVPSQAQLEAHQAAWLEVFHEFGLPLDTPTPDHIPIIRQCIEADGKEAEKFLRFGGKYARAST